MRFRNRIAHRRRVWYYMRRVVLLLAVVFPGALAGQSLTLPGNAPASIVVGKNAIVRPIVRDAINRPTSVARVQALAVDTTVVRVTYATGGQRLTALKVGVTDVVWRWQRTDGKVITTVQHVRVIEVGTVPPPVDTVPTPPTADTLPPPPADTAALELVTGVVTDPVGEFTLAAGDTMTMRIVGGIVGAQGAPKRAASAAELAATAFVWSNSGYARATAAPDGMSAIISGTINGQRGRIDVYRDRIGGPLLGQRWVTGTPGTGTPVVAPPGGGTTPAPGDTLPTPPTTDGVLIRIDIEPGVNPIAFTDDSLVAQVTVTGGTIKMSNGKLRAATMDEIKAGPIHWNVAGVGISVLDISADRLTATFTPDDPDNWAGVAAAVVVCAIPEGAQYVEALCPMRGVTYPRDLSKHPAITGVRDPSGGI